MTAHVWLPAPMVSTVRLCLYVYTPAGSQALSLSCGQNYHIKWFGALWQGASRRRNRSDGGRAKQPLSCFPTHRLLKLVAGTVIAGSSLLPFINETVSSLTSWWGCGLLLHSSFPSAISRNTNTELHHSVTDTLGGCNACQTTLLLSLADDVS